MGFRTSVGLKEQDPKLVEFFKSISPYERGDLKDFSPHGYAYRGFGLVPERLIYAMTQAGLDHGDYLTWAEVFKYVRANQFLVFLESSTRSINAVDGLTLGKLIENRESETLRIGNFGRKSLNELKEKLHGLGIVIGVPLEEQTSIQAMMASPSPFKRTQLELSENYAKVGFTLPLTDNQGHELIRDWPELRAKASETENLPSARENSIYFTWREALRLFGPSDPESNHSYAEIIEQGYPSSVQKKLEALGFKIGARLDLQDQGIRALLDQKSSIERKSSIFKQIGKVRDFAGRIPSEFLADQINQGYDQSQQLTWAEFFNALNAKAFLEAFAASEKLAKPFADMTVGKMLELSKLELKVILTSEMLEKFESTLALSGLAVGCPLPAQPLVNEALNDRSEFRKSQLALIDGTRGFVPPFRIGLDPNFKVSWTIRKSTPPRDTITWAEVFDTLPMTNFTSDPEILRDSSVSYLSFAKALQGIDPNIMTARPRQYLHDLETFGLHALDAVNLQAPLAPLLSQKSPYPRSLLTFKSRVQSNDLSRVAFFREELAAALVANKIDNSRALTWLEVFKNIPTRLILLWAGQPELAKKYENERFETTVNFRSNDGVTAALARLGFTSGQLLDKQPKIGHALDAESPFHAIQLEVSPNRSLVTPPSWKFDPELGLLAQWKKQLARPPAPTVAPEQLEYITWKHLLDSNVLAAFLLSVPETSPEFQAFAADLSGVALPFFDDKGRDLLRYKLLLTATKANVRADELMEKIQPLYEMFDQLSRAEMLKLLSSYSPLRLADVYPANPNLNFYVEFRKALMSATCQSSLRGPQPPSEQSAQ